MNDKPYIKVLLLIATTTLLLTGCASTEITQTKTDATVELGSACNLNITDFFELGSKVNTSDILIDTSSVDANTIGDYDASTGKGSLSTKLDEDTVDELKAFAEIQYRLSYKHITPNVNVNFGDVHETADVQDITKYIKKIMEKDIKE